MGSKLLGRGPEALSIDGAWWMENSKPQKRTKCPPNLTEPSKSDLLIWNSDNVFMFSLITPMYFFEMIGLKLNCTIVWRMWSLHPSHCWWALGITGAVQCRPFNSGWASGFATGQSCTIYGWSIHELYIMFTAHPLFRVHISTGNYSFVIIHPTHCYLPRIFVSKSLLNLHDLSKNLPRIRWCIYHNPMSLSSDVYRYRLGLILRSSKDSWRDG